MHTEIYIPFPEYQYGIVNLPCFYFSKLLLVRSWLPCSLAFLILKNLTNWWCHCFMTTGSYMSNFQACMQIVYTCF